MSDDNIVIWRDPPGNVCLKENELHLWYADLDQFSEFICKLFNILSADEQSRAVRYAFISDRNRFIAGRAILRILLSRYLTTLPKLFDFSYNVFGKPELSLSPIRFNLSHSGGKAVYAFSLNAEVGTDIEKIREDINEMELAGHFFSTEEIKTLAILPLSIRKKAFFNCWSRKEAFIKANGQGLSMKLDSFSVPILPFSSDELLPVNCNLPGEDNWKLKVLDMESDYSAAVAVMKEYENIRYWKMCPELEFFCSSV